MKKIWLICVLLVALQAVQAAEITSYTLDITIEESFITEKAEIFVANPLSDSSTKLFLPPETEKLLISINDEVISCDSKQIIGFTEVTCETPGTDYFVDLEFKSEYPLISLTEKSLFSQEFLFASEVRMFALRIKLPERAVLPKQESKFLTPEPDRVYSDGRRIILSYTMEDISNFDVSVIFEPESKSKAFVIWTVLGIIIATFGFWLSSKKAKKKEKELHLLPDEKEVLKLIKNAGKTVRQKDIEKQVDFSKAKLSRVLRALEERKLIEKIPKGNTNLIKLVK